MLRVRFPHGQCIQYNTVNEVEWQANGSLQLLRKDENNKRWICVVIAPGTEFLYEWIEPCAVKQPLAREVTPESALALVVKHLRTLPGYSVRDLKNALRDFNAKRRSWKT